MGMFGFTAAHADESNAAASKLEVRIAANNLIGFGPTLGYWGGEKLPILARVTLGVVNGQGLNIGAQGEVGLQLDPTSSFAKYVVATAAMSDPLVPNPKFSVGTAVGVRYKALFAQLGPVISFQNGRQNWEGSGTLGFSTTF